MSNQPKDQFLSALLQQDQPLSLPVYQEYRAMLEQNLAAAVLKERFARRLTSAMWIAVFALVIVGVLGMFSLPITWKPIAVSLFMLGYGLFWLALLRLAMYLIFERRALDMARTEVREAMLLELTRRVDAIAQRLEAKA